MYWSNWPRTLDIEGHEKGVMGVMRGGVKTCGSGTGLYLCGIALPITHSFCGNVVVPVLT